MSCCLTKSLSEVSQEGHLDTAFLDTVTEKSAISWQEQIVLNGNLTPFKLNIGDEVTAITPDTECGITQARESFFRPIQKAIKSDWAISKTLCSQSETNLPSSVCSRRSQN